MATPAWSCNASALCPSLPPMGAKLSVHAPEGAKLSVHAPEGAKLSYPAPDGVVRLVVVRLVVVR